MPLDADQLDAFWHVVQAGGVHEAAAVLHLTQPAVTQRIRALEAALGQRLFMRAGRGVALTEAGRTLARHCRVQRQAEAELLHALGGGPGGLAGRLAVAAGTAEGVRWVVPALAALGAAHPHLEIAVRLVDPPDPATLLESGQADVVVGELPARRQGLRSAKLAEVPHVLVVHPALAEGWPDEPPLEALLAHRAIDFGPADRITLDHLAACFPGGDLGALRRHYVDDTQAIARWAEVGGGFAVLPRAAAPAGLRVLFPAIASLRPLYASAAQGPGSRVVEAAIAAIQSSLSIIKND